MNEAPQCHDFDWVTARHECSVANEFVRLRECVRASVAKRRKLRPEKAQVDFNFTPAEDDFTVRRHPVQGTYGDTYNVTFSLHTDHISVTTDWQGTNASSSLRVTLNDAGECRITIDNEGEYLRWQVARRMLCGLLFEGPRRG